MERRVSWRGALFQQPSRDCEPGEAIGTASVGLLDAPLLDQRPDRLARWLRTLYGAALDIIEVIHQWFQGTTDTAFIRSEVNGRQSRRIVLFAFFCTDLIGATLWASWCEAGGVAGAPSPMSFETEQGEQARACSSFGINHFLLLGVFVPAEGCMLFLAGKTPWSFWSDALLIPVWLVRLGLFDVLLWNVPPQTLVADALWFSVMAVMCRVHSLALLILVMSQVSSLFLVLILGGALAPDTFDRVRYGIYSVAMMVIIAGAYLLDEQSRLQSFGQLMSLQEKNAVLAERLLRWKVLPESPSANVGSGGIGVTIDSRELGSGGLAATGACSPAAPLPPRAGGVSGWRHIVLEEPDFGTASSSSGSFAGHPAMPSVHAEFPLSGDGITALPLPMPPQQIGWPSRPTGQRVRFCFPENRERGQRLPVPTRQPRARPGLGQSARQAPVSVLEAME